MRIRYHHARAPYDYLKWLDLVAEARASIGRPYRYATLVNGSKFPVYNGPPQAVTVCELTAEDGDELPGVSVRGYALCSTRDQFSRARGRAIAFGRARLAMARARAGQSMQGQHA